jgi:DNA-binding NarL/FixJ family response regulator
MTNRPVRVLLVEDNALLARELTAAMKELGDIEVTAVAVDENQACRALRQQPPQFDVLVIDVFLATGSGLGVLRTAKALGLPLKVYMLTNFATLDVRKRCIALGADRIFDKSRQIDEFLTEVASLAEPPEPRPTADLGADTQWP